MTIELYVNHTITGIIQDDLNIMYQSPFSPNEIKYFMNLMQNDNATNKYKSTYAKLEVLYAQNVTKKQVKRNKR